MKTEEIILVSERKGKQDTRFLVDLKEQVMAIHENYYTCPEYVSLTVAELMGTKENPGGWVMLQTGPEVCRHARFCDSKRQLQEFLAGGYGYDGREETIFDEGRCTPECLKLLKGLNLGTDGKALSSVYHYQKIQHGFREGETVRNMNGHEYRVIEVLTERNLLLMDLLDGEITVGIDTEYFERTPEGTEVPPEYRQRGMEWGHGAYLGRRLTEIDFDEVKRNYGQPERAGDLTGYRKSLEQLFALYQKILGSEEASEAVKQAVAASALARFRTADWGRFRDRLQNGIYDDGFPGKGRTAPSSPAPYGKSR